LIDERYYSSKVVDYKDERHRNQSIQIVGNQQQRENEASASNAAVFALLSERSFFKTSKHPRVVEAVRFKISSQSHHVVNVTSKHLCV
jgi:hypothetical protein